MATATLQYKLLKKIKDDRFDEEQIHQYKLLLNIGSRDLQTCVIDSKDNRVLLMEDYIFPTFVPQDEMVPLFDQLFDNHPVLNAGFWGQIKIGFKNQKFIQVPSALYVEDAKEEYLQFNANLKLEKEKVFQVLNERSDAISVFSVPTSLVDWFNHHYPNNPPVFIHQSAALIEGAMQYASTQKGNPLFIYIDRFKLHIISCKDGKLIYYNQFVIKQFSDYVKYIMLVFKSLQIDQQSSKVILWGYIGKNSPHFQEFYKYIQNVTFGDRPNYLQFGYLFDEIQDHHYFDLLSLYLIG